MDYFLILLLALSFSSPVQEAFAQSPIIINQTVPCFLQENVTKLQILKDCGLEDDFLNTMLLPWEWATGGYFSMVLVIILMFITYMKYGKAIYPMIIGTLFLPMAFYLIPSDMLTIALLLLAVTIGIWIWYIYVRQTKDYSS